MKLSRGQGCLAAMVLTPLLLWGAYKLFYPTYTWKEKIAVTVVTPNGEKAGSAVRKIKVVRTPSPLPQTSDAVISVEGEAVVVDMGNGRYLFSLLGAPLGWTPVVYQSLYPDSVGKRDMSSWESSLRGKGPLPIPEGKHPLLVTFGDINDPASVKRVDPANLTASFSPGYTLKSITLEITNEPVTEGKVEAVLGWLENHKGRIKPTSKKFADELTAEENLYRGDFIKGN